MTTTSDSTPFAEQQQAQQTHTSRSQTRSRNAAAAAVNVPSRPSTPLRPPSRTSLRASQSTPTSAGALVGAAAAGSEPLSALEPAFAELSDGMADLEANLMHLQLLHESLGRFNESFGAFLYGMNMSAFCVDFPEAPIPQSFARHKDSTPNELAHSPFRSGARAGGGGGGGGGETTDATFLTTDTSFVENPPPTSTAKSSSSARKPATGRFGGAAGTPSAAARAHRQTMAGGGGGRGQQQYAGAGRGGVGARGRGGGGGAASGIGRGTANARAGSRAGGASGIARGIPRGRGAR